MRKSRKTFAARAALDKKGARSFAYVGRSFGGRVCTFLAVEEPPRALVVLGYPLAPKGVLRTDDAAALLALRCPTLIIQGDRDELGPLRFLRRVAKQNKTIELVVIRGAGHSYGTRERETLALQTAADFLSSVELWRDKSAARR